MENDLTEIGVDKLKQLQIEILNAVADFCDKNDIHYWLDFGTLIGAIRHKGYIPWDDDVDLGMLREDYDKFMATFNGANDRYEFKCYELDKNFPYAFGKVMDKQTVIYEPDERGHKLAVNIDIFPYDKAPSEKAAKKIYKKRDKYNICQTARMHKGRAKGNILRRFAVACLKIWVKLFPRDYFVKRIVKNAKRYSQQEARFVGDFTGSLTNFACDRSVFDNFIEAEFEGKTYKVPQRYDELLHMVYGDYMQFPPEEQRVSHHKFKAYIKGNKT